MNRIGWLFGIVFIGMTRCTTETVVDQGIGKVLVVGAMKNVMWQGKLGGVINLDTLQPKAGLYGLGPKSYLQGELLINDGVAFLSTVVSDTTMKVEKMAGLEAPFFVYGHVKEWQEVRLPEGIMDIKQIEQFVDSQSKSSIRPFVFKLIGKIRKADIHIQNLPEGTQVSSPKEAHQGQVNYLLTEEEVEIIGFFSTEHHGIFTHHDSNVHMHLITKDQTKMGHLDQIELDGKQMLLYLPKK